mgnify:CR=1 FL=1
MITGFGIIGCGMISKFHAQALAAIDGARLAGVFDPTPASMARAARDYGVRAFESMEAMLSCPEIDAVCVLTPNGLHAPIALQALAAGKHVVVEKPMAITMEDADRLVAASEAAGLQFCVISQLRFSPAVQAVKRAVEAGELGRIVSASLSMKYYRDDSYYVNSGWHGTWAMDGGGALMNQGIHGVDLLQYLAGPVRRLSAVCKTQTRPIETEDSAVAILEFESGAVGTLEASTACRPGYPRRLEICGDRGGVTLEEEDILRWDLPCPKPDLTAHAGAASSDPTAIDARGHERQLRNMVSAIQSGERLLVDAREGRKPVQIILSVYESAKTHSPVTLSQE